MMLAAVTATQKKISILTPHKSIKWKWASWVCKCACVCVCLYGRIYPNRIYIKKSQRYVLSSVSTVTLYIFVCAWAWERNSVHGTDNKQTTTTTKVVENTEIVMLCAVCSCADTMKRINMKCHEFYILIRLNDMMQFILKIHGKWSRLREV